MASILDSRFPFPAAEPAAPGRGRLARLGRLLVRLLADYRGRRALLALSDAQLKDIGLSRADLGPQGVETLRAVDWTDLQRRRDGQGR
jgi:uncharacterized protein YjiS (DUF1127 family)